MVSDRAFKPLPLCSAPWKHTSRDYWSSRNKRQPLSKLKHVLRKCSEVSQKQWMLELSNLCHCVQLPWKLTSGDFWSSRKNRKSFSQQKCVLRKCSGVSQKQWVLELSNVCHCVQHPENILVGITGALGMKGGVDLPNINSSWPQDVSTGG